MLKAPTPFPQVGSYALLELDGTAQAVRIQRKDPATPDEATVALQSVANAASGFRTVPLAELIDGTPLTEAEAQEYRELERTVPAAPSRSNRVKEAQARYAALRERAIHSDTLARLLAEPKQRAA
jgi:hypothetical protein